LEESIAMSQIPKPPALAVGSANSLSALEITRNTLREGSTALDAAIAAVNVVELDPLDHSVGYGGLPNFDGVVQLDL
jgi:N4-(beta-N-acetylglucosaminyl)-L-asparaginase